MSRRMAGFARPPAACLSYQQTSLGMQRDVALRPEHQVASPITVVPFSLRPPRPPPHALLPTPCGGFIAGRMKCIA